MITTFDEYEIDNDSDLYDFAITCADCAKGCMGNVFGKQRIKTLSEYLKR